MLKLPCAHLPHSSLNDLVPQTETGQDHGDRLSPSHTWRMPSCRPEVSWPWVVPGCSNTLEWVRSDCQWRCVIKFKVANLIAICREYGETRFFSDCNSQQALSSCQVQPPGSFSNETLACNSVGTERQAMGHEPIIPMMLEYLNWATRKKMSPAPQLSSNATRQANPKIFYGHIISPNLGRRKE